MTGSDLKKTSPRRRVGIFGGSFDPIHLGHVALAELFCQLLQLDELLVIPAGNPWQKSGLIANATDRVTMVALAMQDLNARLGHDHPVQVKIDEREILRGKASYTFETLTELRNEYGKDASLCLLLGADQLARLHTWHEWERLLELAHLCIAARPGYSLETATLAATLQNQIEKGLTKPAQLHRASHGKVILASTLAVDISSTTIRYQLAHGIAPLDYLGPAVLDYIQQHHLYIENQN